MNKVLKKRVEDFRILIEPLDTRDTIKECKKEVKKLLEDYSATTARTYLTTYRKVLNIDNKRVLDALTIPKNVQNSIEKAYKKKIAKSQKKGTKVYNINTMIETAIELLDSDHIGELVAGLALLTGRRATEILKTAKFTNYKSSQKEGFFAGQLKTKDSEQTQKYKIYFIGGTRDKCKKALKKLRKLAPTKTLSNNEVARKYENLVNRYVDRYFSHFIGVLGVDRATAHTLRNVYALQCTKEYKKEWQTTNSFLAEILGHGIDDVSTANSYQKYYL